MTKEESTQDNSTQGDYISEFTVDEQGRRVETRRYKPGFKPNHLT